MGRSCEAHEMDEGSQARAELWRRLLKLLSDNTTVSVDGGGICPLCLLEVLAVPDKDVQAVCAGFLDKYREYMKLADELGL
jgi:hypothetical protein